MENKENQEANATAKMIELLHRVLRSIGCQPVDVDHETIETKYQGEQFLFSVNKTDVRICDPYWGSVKEDDPSLHLFYQAINLTNTECSPTVFLSAPDENGLMYTHSRWDLKLYPECPDNEAFIRDALNTILEVKQYLRKCTYDLFVFKIEKERKRCSGSDAAEGTK